MHAYPWYLPDIWYLIWKTPIQCDPDIRYLEPCKKAFSNIGTLAFRPREKITWVFWILWEDSFKKDLKNRNKKYKEYTHQQFQMFQRFQLFQQFDILEQFSTIRDVNFFLHNYSAQLVTPQLVLLYLLLARGL